MATLNLGKQDHLLKNCAFGVIKMFLICFIGLKKPMLFFVLVTKKSKFKTKFWSRSKSVL